MAVTSQATLYRGEKQFLAYPSNQTVAGFYLDSAPFVPVENEVPLEIGRSLRLALAHHKVGVAVPSREEYPAFAKERLRAAGVRSEAAFMRGARMVGITKNKSFVLEFISKPDLDRRSEDGHRQAWQSFYRMNCGV